MNFIQICPSIQITKTNVNYFPIICSPSITHHGEDGIEPPAKPAASVIVGDIRVQQKNGPLYLNATNGTLEEYWRGGYSLSIPIMYVFETNISTYLARWPENTFNVDLDNPINPYHTPLEMVLSYQLPNEYVFQSR